MTRSLSHARPPLTRHALLWHATQHVSASARPARPYPPQGPLTSTHYAVDMWLALTVTGLVWHCCDWCDERAAAPPRVAARPAPSSVPVCIAPRPGCARVPHQLLSTGSVPLRHQRRVYPVQSSRLKRRREGAPPDPKGPVQWLLTGLVFGVIAVRPRGERGSRLFPFASAVVCH